MTASIKLRRISDLMRGKIDLFSIDALVAMFAPADRYVEISLESPEDQAA